MKRQMFSEYIQEVMGKTLVKPFDSKINMKNMWSESNGFPKFFIWYYRVIGVTFGGIQVKGINHYVSNKWLKYYGYFATICYTLIMSYVIHLKMNDPDILLIYNNGFRLTYYLNSFILSMDIIQIIINQWYLNSNAIHMIENIGVYGLSNILKNCLKLRLNANPFSLFRVRLSSGVLLSVHQSNDYQSDLPLVHIDV